MKNIVKFAAALAVLCALVSSSAFAQVQVAGRTINAASFRDAIDRAEKARDRMLMVRNGKILGGVPVEVHQSNTKVLVWSDRKFYLPGEEIKIRALGLSDDAENLQVWITEQLVDDQGNYVTSDSYPCECGDGNGGFIQKLTGYSFITLVNKRVPASRIGQYRFYVSFRKFSGFGDPGMPYQDTNVNVFATRASKQEDAPIVVETMQQIQGSRGLLLLTGKFPVNTPMSFFVGAPPYEGSFSSEPSLISTDGYSLVVGAVTGSLMEGRVVLMLPDGSYSTITPQTFVPEVVQYGKGY